MSIKPVIGAACATIAIAFATPAAAQDQGEVVTPHFEHAIPNIPGKSLVALVVDYTPEGASPSHGRTPKLVYRVGKSWYETLGSFQRVSRKGGGGRVWPRWRHPARPGK